MTAEHFAEETHRGQRYGTDKSLPYTYHLERVVQALRHFGFGKDKALINAGWLHDTIEDTGTRWGVLWAHFGVDTADLVEAVTDRPGKNRRERHERTYPGIRRFGRRAVALKLADRIANVEYSIKAQDEGKLKMYRKENALFTSFLYKAEDGLDSMWDHLGGLLGFERPDQAQYSEDDA